MSIRGALNIELGREVKRLREENEEVHAAAVQKQKELMEMRMDMVTEELPGLWDQRILSSGAFAGMVIRPFCPKCGFPMMLCGECLVDSDDFCDWDGSTILCHRRSRDCGRIWRMLCLTRTRWMFGFWKASIS